MARLSDSVLLCEIAKSLVEDYDSVQVTESNPTGAGATHLLIRVAPRDRGKVIGKEGRTIDSIRNIFMCIASLEKRRVFIEIDET